MVAAMDTAQKLHEAKLCNLQQFCDKELVGTICEGQLKELASSWETLRPFSAISLISLMFGAQPSHLDTKTASCELEMVAQMFSLYLLMKEPEFSAFQNASHSL